MTLVDAFKNSSENKKARYSLSLEQIRAIEHLCHTVDQNTWEEAHSVVITYFCGRPFTLWKAITIVDPSFPKWKLAGEPWTRIPSPEVIHRALFFAGYYHDHEEKAQKRDQN